MDTLIPLDKKEQKKWLKYFIMCWPDINQWHTKYKATPKFYRMMFYKLAIERHTLHTKKFAKKKSR